ncbi:MAG: cobalamin B12-binding domain-containing protein [Promethearchaeota archaeon]
MDKKIRVLITKPGLDGHYRGGIVVSRALRDAGMEVIFGGFQNSEQIVETAIQEDVDVIGISIHSGAHFAYSKQIIDLLKEKGVFENFIFLVGGVIPTKDFEQLKEIGVSNVFGPGAMVAEIIDYIKNTVK